MSATSSKKKIIVLGASGLIGRFVANDLAVRGVAVTGIARRFAPGQMSPQDREAPLVSLEVAELAALLDDCDLVVNCLGVLQDGPGHDTRAVHRDFVARLLQAMAVGKRPPRLVHVSIPGDANDDVTAFSRSKREAERLIAASGLRHAILHPGFVVAPAAYGGSALLRALAALPIDLPAVDRATPFQPVAVRDIATTIAWLADHPEAESVVWDLMQPQGVTLGDVIAEFRRSFGTAGGWRVTLPAMLLNLGAKLGDLASLFGWSPPICSTALAELRRGVTGEPSAWMSRTAIAPTALQDAIGRGAASVQDKWFARLYLVKALIVVALCVFWIASGFVALFVSYESAAAILSTHRFPSSLVAPVTVGSSIMDMTIGLLIAFRRTTAIGLIVGIIVSLGYMSGAAVLTPDLWVEPLGALVKTGPAIVLMLVALLTLDNR